MPHGYLWLSPFLRSPLLRTKPPPSPLYLASISPFHSRCPEHPHFAARGISHPHGLGSQHLPLLRGWGGGCQHSCRAPPISCLLRALPSLLHTSLLWSILPALCLPSHLYLRTHRPFGPAPFWPGELLSLCSLLISWGPDRDRPLHSSQHTHRAS